MAGLRVGLRLVQVSCVRLRSGLFRGTASEADRVPPVTMGNRPSPTDTDGVARDDQRGRQLAALKFVGRRFDPIKNIVDKLTRVAGRDDFFRRSFLLEMKVEDRIQLV